MSHLACRFGSRESREETSQEIADQSAPERQNRLAYYLLFFLYHRRRQNRFNHPKDGSIVLIHPGLAGPSFCFPPDAEASYQHTSYVLLSMHSLIEKPSGAS
jgi:hypothetical protein